MSTNFGTKRGQFIPWCYQRLLSILSLIYLLFIGTYCQQREVEAITEGIEEDEGNKFDLQVITDTKKAN